MTKLGIIREGKIPIDRRVPLTPAQAQQAKDRFNIDIVVQPSDIRCYSNKQYQERGITIQEDLADCDILMGVKEVPIDHLISHKTYLFFSHTIKMQPYNYELFQAIKSQSITLIDYEVITDAAGKRLIAFGRYAGIVGAYNGLWTFGKRYNLFDIKRAHECFDLEELKRELDKVELPAIKIALTGGGRVAKGAMEVLNHAKVQRVSPGAYLEQVYEKPVYTQLNSRDYHLRKDGGDFNRSEYYHSPGKYQSDFLKYAEVSDLFIAGAYWDPAAPLLFTREDILSRKFGIKVVADITCDIEGSIPSTVKSTTIEDPIYDYNPSEHKIEAPLSDEANITVMAVDNLPCELPRDASQSFGQQLMENVFPHLLDKQDSSIIDKATITKKGHVTPAYQYLDLWEAPMIS
jgi:alanine dehydrogenase